MGDEPADQLGFNETKLEMCYKWRKSDFHSSYHQLNILPTCAFIIDVFFFILTASQRCCGTSARGIPDDNATHYNDYPAGISTSTGLSTPATIPGSTTRGSLSYAAAPATCRWPTSRIRASGKAAVANM